MSQPQVYGNYSFKMEQLKGAESGLKFFQADLPGGDVQISNVKAYGESGPAVPLSGGGHDHFAFNDWDVPACFDDLLITPYPD